MLSSWKYLSNCVHLFIPINTIFNHNRTISNELKVVYQYVKTEFRLLTYNNLSGFAELITVLCRMIYQLLHLRQLFIGEVVIELFLYLVVMCL